MAAMLGRRMSFASSVFQAHALLQAARPLAERLAAVEAEVEAKTDGS